MDQQQLISRVVSEVLTRLQTLEPTGVFAWRPSGELVVALSDLLAGGTPR